jgi:predicted component of type VI protein secretion system
LQISGAREISRHHATLVKNPDGSFSLDCHGQNPIWLADGSGLLNGQSAPLRAGGTFRLASYQFTIL